MGQKKVLKNPKAAAREAAHGTNKKKEDSGELQQISLSLHGKELVKDTTMELTYGARYGLIGLNGSGKSTILAAIRARELPIPDWIDIWHLHEEAPPSDKTAIKSVVDVVKNEQTRLEALSLEIMERDPESEILATIGDK